MPPWKHRRRLIYSTCIFAAGMIIFAAATFRSDTNVSSQLIVGGVSLLSITLTAYTAFASYEDVKLWGNNQDLKTHTDTVEETLDDQISAS